MDTAPDGATLSAVRRIRAAIAAVRAHRPMPTLSESDEDLGRWLQQHAQIDADLARDPAFGSMYKRMRSDAAELVAKLRRPQQVLDGLGYPLETSEATTLLRSAAIKVDASGSAVRRYGDAIGVPRIGTNSDRLYFARHLLEIAFALQHDLSPQRLTSLVRHDAGEFSSVEEAVVAAHGRRVVTGIVAVDGQHRRGALATAEIAAFFTNTAVRIGGNPLLREPQIEGYKAAVSFFAEGRGIRAVEQIPVGCGKTGLLALLPFGIARGRVLIIAPNLTIRDQIVQALDVSNATSFYRTQRVIDDPGAGPFRAVLNADANRSDADVSHIVVTNIQQLAERDGSWLEQFPRDYFALILVDEGHHNAAPSWKRVFERFGDARVISVTATPFRADEQPIEGESIYRYTFHAAMKNGYVKQMAATNVAPRELRFTFRGESYTHTLAEVLAMREEEWYSRGVALAEQSNISIVDASLQWLNHLRSTGLPHQLIAAACSVDHARQVRSLYQERGYKVREIYSAQPPEEQEAVLAGLEQGTLDGVVQVQMLGEGFDHPRLSVAAVFRPFRSLSPYIQFVGRAMRVNVQHAPGHPDNEGVIVSHVGLNIDRHWEDFKRIDGEDQAVIDEWLGAGDVRPTTEEPGGTRRPLRPEMVVTGEVVDRFLSDSFLDAADDALLDNALRLLREQGLDPDTLGLSREDLQRRLLASRRTDVKPEKLPVQPQARRQALRTRLREQTQAVAVRIITTLGERPGGFGIARLGGTGAPTNMGAAIALMNRAVNDALGIGSDERRELTLEQLELVIGKLDELGDRVEGELRRRLANAAG